MATNLQVNDQFPDFSLPDQQNEMVTLSHFTRPGLFDRYLGFQDGYPLILVFFRGFFCPRDQQQMRHLVEFQRELTVNYGKLVVVSADPPLMSSRTCSFMSKIKRIVVLALDPLAYLLTRSLESCFCLKSMIG